MMSEKKFATFVAKAFMMLLLLALPVFLLGVLPGMQATNDPRKYLFAQKDFSPYRFAIIGDSVFCSYYVDNVQETMWRQFEARTGQPCFPGALNGATIADMMDAAEYLGEQLPTGSTVFVGLIPTRFVGKGIVRHRNYFQDFDQLKKRTNTSLIGRSLTSVADSLFGAFLLYREPYSLEKFMRKKKGGAPVTGYKVWNDTGRDAAFRVYQTFVASQQGRETVIDIVAIDHIRASLASRGSKAVFVLSALNHGLIREFSSPDESEQLMARFRDTHEQLLAYFQASGSDYIDLFGEIDSDCFIDLVHLNRCGDTAMATAFAEYASMSGH